MTELLYTSEMTQNLYVNFPITNWEFITTIPTSNLELIGQGVRDITFYTGYHYTFVPVNLTQIMTDLSTNASVNIGYIIIDGSTSSSEIITSSTSDRFYSMFSESANFNYNRFMERLRIVLERVNAPNLLSTQDITSMRVDGIRNNLRLYSNNFNQDYLWFLLFSVYITFKGKLAFFVAPCFIMFVRLGSSRFPLYLLLLVLMARPVLAADITLANQLISGIVPLLYINFMSWYDIGYKNILHEQLSRTLIRNGRISPRFLLQRIFIGLNWILVINTGVLFTTCISIITITSMSVKYKIIAGVISFIISVISSSIWLKLTDPSLLGYGVRVIRRSYLRGTAESFAFSALSFFNFIIWSFFPRTVIVYATTFIGGLLLYFLFAVFQVYIEANLDHGIWYGFIYTFVFSSLSTSSSGLYSLISMHGMSSSVKWVIIAVCYNLMLLFPLEIYRFKQPDIRLGEANNNRSLADRVISRERTQDLRWRIAVGVLYQLIAFFAFAIGTFVLFDFTGLGVNIV